MRLAGERAAARDGLRYAELAWRRAEELAGEELPDVAPVPQRARSRSSGEGHLCRVCGWVRANERFTGKGHARHVCEDCERAERQRRRQRAKERGMTEQAGRSDAPA